MKQKRTSTWLFALLFAGSLPLAAQEATVPAGGDASGSGGTVNYTFGQVSYINMNVSTAGALTEGVQQTYAVLPGPPNGLEEATGLLAGTSLYPNPTGSSVILKSGLPELSYQIYDVNGRLLSSDKTSGAETVLPTESLNPGTYLVRVSGSAPGAKTFKLIKN